MTQYFENMTEQSNSKTWHQYFVQNLRLLRTGHFEVESGRDSNTAWILVHLKLFYTFEQFNAILEENSLTLHHPVWIDFGWENLKKGRHAVFFTAESSTT